MSNFTICAAAVLVQMLPQLPAQTFEVASIKESKVTDPHDIGMQFLPGGRFVARGVPLLILIDAAYDLPFQTDRMTGGPDWIQQVSYDIEATAGPGVTPAGTPNAVRSEKMRAMLQALFAERFKLKIRHETKNRQVYLLTVSKRGLKLQSSAIDERDCQQDAGSVGKAGGCHGLMGGMGRGIHSEAATISELASWVSNWSDRPVIDKTGVNGLFKIDTEGWTPMRPAPPQPPEQQPRPEDTQVRDPGRPTLFQIFDRLGLKLESGAAPVEAFVIESIERPTAN